MLNWRIEEEDYIKKAIENYFKEENKNPFSFLMSDKTRRKNIQYVTDRAREKYRFEKLLKYESEIIEERKRIDKVVEKINNEYELFISKLSNLISANTKPFKLDAKNYEGFDGNILTATEVITIQCEPLRLSFIQEKVNNQDNK